MAKSKWKTNFYYVLRSEILFILGSAIILGTWYIEKSTLQKRKSRIDEFNRIDNFNNIASHEYKRAQLETNIIILLYKNFSDSADFFRTYNLKLREEIGEMYNLTYSFQIQISPDSIRYFNRQLGAKIMKLNETPFTGGIPTMDSFRNANRTLAWQTYYGFENRINKLYSNLIKDYTRHYTLYLILYIIGTILIISDKGRKLLVKRDKDIKEESSKSNSLNEAINEATSATVKQLIPVVIQSVKQQLASISKSPKSRK